MKKLGLYVHIPFCIRKCGYCDFLSTGNASQDARTAYVDALIREIGWYGKKSGMAGGREIDLREYETDTVFFGGGTPSLIASEDLRRLMDAIRIHFDLASDAEISIEANPGTISAESLFFMREVGFNRLSIGVQSLNDPTLQLLGRIHTGQDAVDSFQWARKAGFDNINLDLMFGIPGQTLDTWTDTLKKAILLEPEHLSFYSLKIEESTPFYDLTEKGSMKPVSDELDRTMYEEALRLIQDAARDRSGRAYIHYEISNAAREGLFCRHNLKYWSMGEYLGIGAGSHSYINRERFSNQTDLDAYVDTDGGQVRWRHQNNDYDEISEYIFTGLRKIEGIRLAEYERRFSEKIRDRFADELDILAGQGLLIVSGESVRLTPKGIDLSNHVLSHFV